METQEARQGSGERAKMPAMHSPCVHGVGYLPNIAAVHDRLVLGLDGRVVRQHQDLRGGRRETAEMIKNQSVE
jgi:hypothetical protein